MSFKCSRDHCKRRRLKDATTITENFVNQDRISELPNDIRLVILSSLGMKDAARMSILSKTWRYSWTYLPDLDFDAEKSLGLKNFRIKKSTYVRWVNQVIKAHRAPRVKKFRISYYLDATRARDIDRWVRFCSRKGVQEFTLDCGGGLGNAPDKNYSVKSMWQLFQPIDTCKTPTFTNLRSFCVEVLNISGAVLELMLSKCPLLETLRLRWCKDIGSLKVLGSSLKLNFLELTSCDVDKVIISAPNLVTIVYWQRHGDLVFNNVPSLVEARFGGCFAKDMIDQLSCSFSQLETLNLTARTSTFRPIPSPSLPNLKRLVLDLLAYRHQSILMWSHLIDSSPSLRELKLEVLHWWVWPYISVFDWGTKATNKTHLCLEDVHVVGFVGCNADVEFAAYLVKIAPLLKRFTIDTRDPIAVRSDKYGISNKEKAEKARRRRARQCAQQLAQQQFPPTLDVVII